MGRWERIVGGYCRMVNGHQLARLSVTTDCRLRPHYLAPGEIQWTAR